MTRFLSFLPATHVTEGATVTETSPVRISSRWALVAGAVTVLALSACASRPQAQAGRNDVSGDSGGVGGMAYPAPTPQGNVATTRVP